MAVTSLSHAPKSLNTEITTDNRFNRFKPARDKVASNKPKIGVTKMK